MLKVMKTLLVVVMALVLTSCGKDDGQKDNSLQPAIEDLTKIQQSGDRLGLVGRKVELSAVKAKDVVGNYVFWVGDVNGGIPVVLESEVNGTSNDNEVNVRSGQTLAISGIVRLVGAIPVSDKMWDMVDAQEKADIDRAVVYIGASSVRVIP